MLRDLRSQINAALSLNPAARTATANGSSVDLQGFGSAALFVLFGTWTDGTHTPSLQDSDDGTTFTNVATVDMDGAFTAVSSAGGNGTVQRVGYLGNRRFLRIVMTITGATTGAVSSAIVVRGAAAQQPV
jgi:hypothetical protein